MTIPLPDEVFDPVTCTKCNIKVIIPKYPSPVNARPIQYDSNNADPSLFLAAICAYKTDPRCPFEEPDSIKCMHEYIAQNQA